MADLGSPLYTRRFAPQDLRDGIVRVTLLLASLALLGSGSLPAAVVVSSSVSTSLDMRGDYVLTGVSNNGTMGVGNSISPGFVFDPDGTGNFSGKPDYLTPGMPDEGFSISYAGSSVLVNNNDRETCQIGSKNDPTNVSASSSYDNAVQWTGTISGVLTVEHLYEFNDDQKNVSITTTLTALTDLTDVEFARWIDPDSGGASSINNRGNTAVGLDAEDWINSVSETNGATLGLYSDSAVAHNTGFTYSWSNDPADYIAGGFNGNGTTTQHTGDDMIGIGFDIGTLNSGNSVVLEYAYVVTADQDDLDIGVGKWIGGSDSLWSNATNWNPERAPSDGENVAIESSGNATVNHNVSGNTYGNWTFNAGGAQVAIQGNDVSIGDGKTLANESSFLQTFAVDVAAAGSLLIHGGTAGLSFQNIQVADGSVLTFNTGSSTGNVIQGAVSGSGSSLVVAGSGTLQLSGNNTYSGGTALNGGTLVAGADAQLGDASGGLSFNGGALSLTNDFNSARNITLNAGGGTINTNANSVELSGDIGGSGALTKVGTGTLTLSGSNSYSGGTAVVAGALVGNTDSLQGDIVNNGTVLFTQTSDGTYAGSISGSGSLTKTGAGTLTLSGNQTFTGATYVAGGALNFNGTATGDLTVRPNTRLSGNATFGDLDNQGTVAPGNSIGTTTVNGNYTHDAGATYEVEINDAGQSDLIDATGTATINGGTVDVQPEAGTYTPGTRYTILEADGGVSGTFDNLLGTVTGARMQLIYNPYDIQLLLTPLYSQAARTPNQRAVAAVLEDMALTASGDVATVLGQLDTVVDNPGGEAYLDQLGGELFGTAASVAIERTSLWLESIQTRLRSVSAYHASGARASGTALALGSPADSPSDLVRGQSPSSGSLRCGWRPWVQGYGISGDVDGDGNAAGCDYSIAGTTVGVDRRLDCRTLVGLAGGYGGNWVDIDQPDQQASVDSGQMAAYLHRITCDYYLTGLFAFAQHSYETTRRIAFGNLARTARGDYDGSEFAFRVEIGRWLQCGRAQLQPYAALQYIQLHQEAFTETGAGSMNLDVDGITTDSFRSVLGSRLIRYRHFGNGRLAAPELHALWHHEFLDEARLVSADYLGAPGNSFVVAGANAGRDTGTLGAACTFYLNDRLSLFANYDFLVGNAQLAHAAGGGAQLLW